MTLRLRAAKAWNCTPTLHKEGYFYVMRKKRKLSGPGSQRNSKKYKRGSWEEKYRRKNDLRAFKRQRAARKVTTKAEKKKQRR